MALLKGIRRFESIKPVSIQVALTLAGEPEKFMFSRTWKVPRLVFELYIGLLKVAYAFFLLGDVGVSYKVLLVGLSILHRLGINSRTLLERNLATLDGTDYSDIQQRTIAKSARSLGRLMIARILRIFGRQPINEQYSKDPPDPQELRENYIVQKFENYFFPYLNIIKATDETRKATKRADIKN